MASAMPGSGPFWLADWIAHEQMYAHDTGYRHAGGATADLLRWLRGSVWRAVREGPCCSWGRGVTYGGHGLGVHGARQGVAVPMRALRG